MKVFSQVVGAGGGGGGAHARWREESPVELSCLETCQLYLGSLPDHLSLPLSPPCEHCDGQTDQLRAQHH